MKLMAAKTKTSHLPFFITTAVLTVLIATYTTYKRYQNSTIVKPTENTCTIAVTETLLWNPSKDNKSPIFAWRENALAYLRSLLKSNIVTLLVRCNSQNEKAAIQSLIASAGLYEAGLDARRIVYYETKAGKTCIVRHISPGFHVDADKADIISLSPYLNSVVYVMASQSSKNTPVGQRKNSIAGFVRNDSSACLLNYSDDSRKYVPTSLKLDESLKNLGNCRFVDLNFARVEE